MKRIFVVGSPRSGTTLLQRLVAAHPSLTSFPESHFFWALCGDDRYRRVLRLAHASRARERLTTFLEECGAPAHRARVDGSNSVFLRPWVELFQDILDDLAAERGATGWVEKTPMHLHYLDVIERYLAEPHVLHIVRRGEEVVASIRRVTTRHPEPWGGERSVEDAVERWLSDVERHRRHLSAPRHVFTRYRDLVDDPAATLRRVLDALGLAFSESLLEAPPPDGVIGADEPWKEGARGAVSPEGARTEVEEVLDEEELRYVRDRVASVDLSAFGPADGSR